VQNFLKNYRRYLASYNSALAYALLGVVGGIASGLVVLAFDLAIREVARLVGVGNGGEGFEALPPLMLFALPAGGALLLGLLYWPLKPEARDTGIVHVVSRMHSHYGVLPLRNALLQFVAGAFALGTGQSGGREGPGVHLGGAINSLLGQRLGLPNNSLRILIACGTAGGIAAAFHTPLAGVIFAMEVIVAEYTVAGFIPVMLAAVSASAVSRSLVTGGALLSIPSVEFNSLLELPYILLLGLACGAVVAGFIRILGLAAQLSNWPVVVRFTMAGCFTGLLALAVPETLGLPVGMIGPSLLIGACLGGAVSILAHTMHPQITSDYPLYIAIGMAAAMGAILNAPLAAILAVIELTNNIGIVMPALLAIVAACLTNTGLFGQRSAHQTMLRQLRRIVPDDPLNQLLHRTDVTATMDVRVVRVPVLLHADDLEPLLEFTPEWCLVERDGEDLYLVQGNELLEWLRQALAEGETADLAEAGIRRWTVAPVPVQATLRQAMDKIRSSVVEAVCVYERSRATGKPILHGVVTRESIEKFSLQRL